MAQNPKYDNDMVNLGYLNKRLGQTEESISKNNNSISQLPKNYSTPPNPPYYKDSLLCYGNKIYRCNKTKTNGTFSWNDWTIVATDDTTISDFIKNTYELEKLEIQEQIDGKIQTHYQDNDPSKDWTTDLEKGRHVGDYWYNTSDNTQWRYNQITTGPTITYGWGQVNIPKSVFDTIDRKKSIYTEKPTSYKKDDLWIIEETLSNDDLPIGTDENPIAKGDWVFSIADSEGYNKEHWVKRDEDVSLSYLEQHYYTITEIDSNLEVIERNTESKITKATEEISLNVSQTYTTKEEHTKAINDFDKQIGTINNTIIEQKETLSDLSVEVGEVSASVSSVETRTEELLVDVNGVKENIIPTATATGSSIYIQDASKNPLTYLEIEGKSTQEVRSGKNKLKNLLTSQAKDGITVTVNNDKSVIFNGTATATTLFYITKDTWGYNSESTILDAGTYTFKNIGTAYEKARIFIDAFNESNKRIYGTQSVSNNDLTFTIEEKASFNIRLEIPSGATLNNQKMYFQIQEGSVSSEYEQYGASPSPDYPSEIESVGYENLFDFDNILYKTHSTRMTITGSVDNFTLSSTHSTGYDFVVWDLGIIDYNKIYYSFNTDVTTSSQYGYVMVSPDGTFESRVNVFEITDTNNSVDLSEYQGQYLLVLFRANVKTTYVSQTITNLIVSKNNVKSYIHYGKSGIEVKTVGKNLFNKETANVGYYINIKTGGIAQGVGFTASDFIEVKPNTQYYCNFVAFASSSYGMAFYDENKTFISGSRTYNSIEAPDNAKYFRFCVRNEEYSSGTFITDINTVQLEEGVATEYQPYQERITVMQLNEPLRSLPNGVKDKAYIKNNKLYVDRYIGSVVLNGSETDWIQATVNGIVYFYINISNSIPTSKNINLICNYFVPNSRNIIDSFYLNNSNLVVFNNGIATTLEEFKIWLSTHNTQVDYELATPVTEEYDEVEMLKTLKGYNNISTTDKLLPIINLTYVRDTVIADYVENHVTELKLTENEIKTSVESVSSSVDGLNTTINRVEEITNDNSQVINVISTNIDRTSGEVREVTTTTGFTFNADGMTIDDGSGFKAQHRSNGTYYKDGDSIVGQYTKDGSKQKDLELFGTYSYGKETIDDTPMFIGQLYTNENGEQAFGHFYNGEG